MKGKNSKIYIYKLLVDNGGAPCVFNNILSLSICKPRIRSTCDIGDWIIGFGARSTIGERLIYIAQITDKVENGEYYRRSKFLNRADSIYRWNEQEKQYYWEKSKKYHLNGTQLVHDIGAPPNYSKTQSLLSTNFRYFGEKGTDSYKENYPSTKLLVESLKQGHRVNYSKKVKWELLELIEENMSKSFTPNGPTEGDPNKICNSDDGAICVK